MWRIVYMDEAYVKSQVYPTFEGYKINKDKSVPRYEYRSSKPIKCHIGKSKMSLCVCGGSVVPLAYVFENDKENSNILLGKKCTKCGNNFFTEKTISLLPKGFYVVAESADNKDNHLEHSVTQEMERHDVSVKNSLYGVYENIFLLAYDKGLDLNKAIQDVSMEIDRLKKEKCFEYEPEGYYGLWMVQSMADKLNVPVSQLFITDYKLRERVVEDILDEAIKEKDNLDIDLMEEDDSKEIVQIEFPIKRRSSFCTRHEVNIYCVELMNFKITNELPNEDRVFSQFGIRFNKTNGVYSICLSGKLNTILNTTYIYGTVEIYSEKYGRLQKFVEECIEAEVNNVLDKHSTNSLDDESNGMLCSSNQSSPKANPMETMGRELPRTSLINRKNTELVALVYDDTHTMDILNQFEGLEENGKPYERLVISNGNRVDSGSKYWLHYVIERSKNKDYVGDITFTNFKLGHVSDLCNHIKEELASVNIVDYVDRDIYIKFKKPFHLRAQNKRNRTGYGWEWDWSSGYGDYTEGTLYGETTDYVFSGVYISSNYLYDQSKRNKISARETLASEIEKEKVSSYKIMVDGYVSGEYTLLVSSCSPSFKSRNKRMQLFIKAERAGKVKYVPVACDTKDKLLYMDKATFDYYRAQMNRQHPLILYKTYIE